MFLRNWKKNAIFANVFDIHLFTLREPISKGEFKNIAI